MIAAISDLHFEEEASDVIKGDGREIIFRRNLDPKAYRSFISHMADEVRRRKAKTFELVIAGDLFDFNRTVLWFRDELRPYIDLGKVDDRLETKVLSILEATVAEQQVKEALDALRLLSKGKYRDGKKERDFPAKSVKLHYIAGNH